MGGTSGPVGGTYGWLGDQWVGLCGFSLAGKGHRCTRGTLEGAGVKRLWTNQGKPMRSELRIIE